MPQFALKEMLGGMGLIAVGLAMVTVSTGPILATCYEDWSAALPIGIWYVGGLFLGAGVFAPFKNVWIGAWVGLTVFCLFDLWV
jgi:hypothetical protein